MQDDISNAEKESILWWLIDGIANQNIYTKLPKWDKYTENETEIVPETIFDIYLTILESFAKECQTESIHITPTTIEALLASMQDKATELVCFIFFFSKFIQLNLDFTCENAHTLQLFFCCVFSFCFSKAKCVPG